VGATGYLQPKDERGRVPVSSKSKQVTKARKIARQGKYGK
jgi:hypothetical protein